ncbi:hypothetical protein EMCG_05420 [[Emmonsia] crescens]|uniref:Replicase polyprotein 1a n=1 Tax=[Emmonsia] crescens TaxID=73230 RepID=A0A0G2HNU8_9EURO|nr:hypothetical protein EMCG_05420 [Emmonsia crescens UAMH 3008]
MEFAGDGGVEAEGGGAFERDLDDDIPDADGEREGEGDVEGLVEEGDEGLEDEEDGLMERDLDDDVPDGFGIDDDDDDDGEDEEDNEDYFDNQRDLDDDIPSAPLSALGSGEEGHSMMERDLDADIPSLAEDGTAQQQQWEHTDTEDDDDEDDDEEDEEEDVYVDAYMEVDTHASPAHHFHSSSSAIPGSSIPHLHPHSSSMRRETEAERLFLQRWGGSGGGGGDSSPVGFESPENIPNQRRRPRRRSVMAASSDSIDM